MTGCGFDSRCDTRKRGLVPMENRIASSNKLGLVLPDIAQLVERSTVDRLVTCSNQVVRSLICQEDASSHK